TFSGSGPSTGNFYNTTSTGYTGTCSTCYVVLYDVSLGRSYFPVASSTANGTLGYDLNNYTVSAGTSKSFTVRLNSAQTGVLQTAANGISQSLSATISAGTHVTWTDAISGGSAISSIPTHLIPITVNSVSYAAGT